MKLYAETFIGLREHLWLLLLVATVIAMNALRQHGGVLETAMQVGFQQRGVVRSHENVAGRD